MIASCQDLVARLSEPGAREDAEVAAHLASCPGCRQASRALEALERTAQSPSTQALSQFPTRVRVARLRAQEDASRRAPLRTGLIAGLSAVGAAAAVVLVLQLAFSAPSAPQVLATANEPAAAAFASEDDFLELGDLSDEDLLDVFAAGDDDVLDDLDT